MEILSDKLKNIYNESKKELKWDLDKRKARLANSKSLNLETKEACYKIINNIENYIYNKESINTYIKSNEENEDKGENKSNKEAHINGNPPDCYYFNSKVKLILPLEVLEVSKKKPICYENKHNKDIYSIYQEFDPNKFHFTCVIKEVKALDIMNETDYTIINAFPSLKYSMLFLPEVFSNHAQYINDYRFLQKAIQMNLRLYEECFNKSSLMNNIISNNKIYDCNNDGNSNKSSFIKTGRPKLSNWNLHSSKILKTDYDVNEYKRNSNNYNYQIIKDKESNKCSPLSDIKEKLRLPLKLNKMSNSSSLAFNSKEIMDSYNEKKENNLFKIESSNKSNNSTDSSNNNESWHNSNHYYKSNTIIGFNSKGATSSVNQLHFQIFYLNQIDSHYNIEDYSILFKVTGAIQKSIEFNKVPDDPQLNKIHKNEYELCNNIGRIERLYYKENLSISFNNTNYDLPINYNFVTLYLTSIINIDGKDVSCDSEEFLSFYFVEYSRSQLMSLCNKYNDCEKPKDNKSIKSEDLFSIISLEVSKTVYKIIAKLNSEQVPYNILIYENLICILPRKHDLTQVKYCIGILELLGAYICYSKEEYEEINTQVFLNTLKNIGLQKDYLRNLFQSLFIN